MKTFHQTLVQMEEVEDVLLDEVADTGRQRRSRHQQRGHEVDQGFEVCNVTFFSGKNLLKDSSSLDTPE